MENKAKNTSNSGAFNAGRNAGQKEVANPGAGGAATEQARNTRSFTPTPNQSRVGSAKRVHYDNEGVPSIPNGQSKP